MLNAPVLTTFGKFEFVPLSIEEARQIVRRSERVESAVGHAATAEVMSKTLDFEVKPNRTEFFQTVEDKALIFKLKKRAPEGQILNAEEIEKIGYEFGLLSKIE